MVLQARVNDSYFIDSKGQKTKAIPPSSVSNPTAFTDWNPSFNKMTPINTPMGMLSCRNATIYPM